jgi:hypothetical protein
MPWGRNPGWGGPVEGQGAPEVGGAVAAWGEIDRQVAIL